MDPQPLDGVCLISENPDSEVVQKWSHYLAAPVNPVDTSPFRFFIFENQNSFVLKDAEGRKFAIDFDQNHLDYKRRRHQGKNELIAKALGVAKGCRKVLDLSVGMAVDSVFLCQLGFEVQGVERNPLLFAVLSQAFSQTQQEVLKSYRLYHADSLSFLRQQKHLLQFDSIYFDPMYPHKKKSALPRQEMVLFRQLVGDDLDASEVLKEALTWPVKRVVVKRPLQAEELLPGVAHAYEGKVVRYDTYVPR